MNGRDQTIQRIKAALQIRSGQTWSVTGGKGTAWGWITIDAPPKRRTWGYQLPDDMPDLPQNWQEYDTGKPGGHMAPHDRVNLAALLKLDSVHFQGVSIPAGSDYWQEYVDRAEGKTPTRYGAPYWD